MRDENSVKISRIASALERTYSLRYFMNFQFTRILFAWFYVSKAHITLPIFLLFYRCLPSGRFVRYIWSIRKSCFFFYLMKQWLMRVIPTGTNSSRVVSIAPILRISMNFIQETEWPSKFNWEGCVRVRKRFFERLIKCNIRRRLCEMRPFSKRVRQNENEIFLSVYSRCV